MVIPTTARRDPGRFAEAFARSAGYQLQDANAARDTALMAAFKAQLDRQNQVLDNAEWGRRAEVTDALGRDRDVFQQNLQDDSYYARRSHDAALSTTPIYTPRRYDTGGNLITDGSGGEDIMDLIIKAAGAAGVDPATAVGVAYHESGMRPIHTSVPGQSADGVFQITDDTWNALGGGDRSNINVQVQNGINNLVQHTQAFKQQFGRMPSAGELYIMHHLGGAGGMKALQADPSAELSSFISPEALSVNSHFADMQNAGDLRSWADTVMAPGMNLASEHVKAAAKGGGGDLDRSVIPPEYADRAMPMRTADLDFMADADKKYWKHVAVSADGNTHWYVRLTNEELAAERKNRVPVAGRRQVEPTAGDPFIAPDGTVITLED